MRKLVGFLLILLVLSACSSDVVFDQNVDIENYQLHQDSIYVFETDSLTEFDLGKAIRFGLNFRNTTDYKYRNVWFFMEITVPDGKVYRDTIQNVLMTTDGFWMDHVTGNSIKESKAYYKYGISNPISGRYKVAIQQGMRDEVLEEVVSIGVCIEQIK